MKIQFKEKTKLKYSGLASGRKVIPLGDIEFNAGEVIDPLSYNNEDGKVYFYYERMLFEGVDASLIIELPNHYEYCEKYFLEFARKVGANTSGAAGIVTAHGDKCYGSMVTAEDAGIPFNKWAAIYLLTYLQPFSQECRQTHKGWVDVNKWIVANKDRFLKELP